MAERPNEDPRRLQPSTVNVVRQAEREADTEQTPAISRARVSDSSMWAGLFVVEPLAKTAIHHHGDQDTVVYVLEGEALIVWGSNEEQSATVGVGDFVHVPRWLPVTRSISLRISHSNGSWYEARLSRSWSIYRRTPGRLLRKSIVDEGRMAKSRWA